MRHSGEIIIHFAFASIIIFCLVSCQTEDPDKRIKQIEPGKAAAIAKSIEATVSPQIAAGFTLKLWGIDSLVADPVAIDIDDHGRIYYTRTNRQKNSEFDIRGHQDWEIESIQLQSIEDKRAFLHRILSPENSNKNLWLADLNGDGSHDWKDLTIEKEHVYRVEDISGDGVADKSQLVVEDFHDEVTDAAGGILKHGNDLFVDIGPDMWRIQENKDGLAEKITSISHGYGIHVGFSGHGMSGIEVGPEGKIYWQIGDIGFNGVSPDGKKWEHPNSGVVVRSNPDGSDFEVFAYGNRNTHEFVFDEYGNLISEDNDGDHPGESERLVYIVNGADIGWRTNWQFGKYGDPDNNSYKVWMDEKMYVPRFEGQPAYILPTIKNFVNGPTGMLYNPGTALSKEYKNTFFIAEFVGNPTRSGIHAFKLKPKGASFEFVESNMILSGILATGIDFGPDGALYLADWIDGWGTKDSGRIWKLDVDESNTDERKKTQELLATDFLKYKVETLGEHLKNPDMRVRQKAQFELVTRKEDGLEIFKKYLLQKENQLARVHAIWGISQFARKELTNAELLVPYLTDSDPEIRAQAAKWIGDVRYTQAGDQLIALLNDEFSRARFFAAEALGRIAYEPAINPLIELLEFNNDVDEYIRHAASLALARIGKPEPIVALSTHHSRAVRIGGVLALRRMQNPGIKNFLQDKDEFIVTETARAINDDLSIVEALPALGDALNDYQYSQEAFVRRAISANLRVGTDKAMQNLINYTQHEGSPMAMRVEALDALSTWAKPSVLDRVDGRYRGVITRDLATVQNKSASIVIPLLTNKESLLRQQAAKTIGKLKMTQASEQLLTQFKRESSPAVRVEIIRALASIEYKPMDEPIKLALADKDKSVRIVGLDLLGKLDVSQELMVSLLAEVINTRTNEEKQAAITTLGAVPIQFSEKLFNQLLTNLESGKLPAEVQLELGDAIDSTHSQALIDRYKKLNRNASTDSLKAAYAGSLLGGDPRRGAGIFWEHPTAQCVRCHSYNDYGGIAGPRINGVANRLTREQILESLIEPSERIAAGFGIVSLELKNNKKISGIMQQEKSDGFILKIGDKPDTLILKTDILRHTYSPSSMPPMQYLLTKKEIRDVVSFLATLKSDD
jgi:putative heme-binding domain-containing protein